MGTRRSFTALATALAAGTTGVSLLVSPSASGVLIEPGASRVRTDSTINARVDPSRSTNRQVHAARAATRGFQTPGRATGAGYALLRDKAGIACIAMPGMGGMGVHYVKGDLVDSAVHLRQPEALVYRFARNGHLRLAALEYVVLQKDWVAARGAAAARPRLFGHRFDLTPAGNRFGLPAFYSLHAWVWKRNPAGRFAMFNPRVHCPPGI